MGASLYIGEVGGVSIGGWFVCVDWEPAVSHDVCMMFISSLYSFFCRWYVFNLLCRNLTAAYLWWAGWFEKYGIIVKEGFLYIEIFQLEGVLWMVMSRKLIWLLDSVSAVNFMFGWIVLKSFCMLFMSVWLES